VVDGPAEHIGISIEDNVKNKLLTEMLLTVIGIHVVVDKELGLI